VAAHHWNIPVTMIKKCPRPECGCEDVLWTGAATGSLIGEKTRLDTPARKTYICSKCATPFRYDGD
jgi:hypothetical protein